MHGQRPHPTKSVIPGMSAKRNVRASRKEQTHEASL
jgi:hypothetical protein